MADNNFLDEIDLLQTRYLRALSKKDMTAWANCFGDPGSYICTTRENEEQNLPIALMLDDSRSRIDDRVKYITEVWAGTFEDYVMRHFVQRMSVDLLTPDTARVESNVLVAYTTVQGQSEILITGQYYDRVAMQGGKAIFEEKKVVLDTVTTPRYLVYPV